ARDLGQDGAIREGVVEGDELQEISGLDGMLRGGRRVGARKKLAEVRLERWGTARKIVAVGRNYGAHARELGHEVPKEPLIFMKPTSALIGNNQIIELPKASSEVHHE